MENRLARQGLKQIKLRVAADSTRAKHLYEILRKRTSRPHHKNVIEIDVEDLPRSGQTSLITSIYGKVGLAVALIWTNTAAAAEHRLSGRWLDGSNAVGVIQSGRTVFVFSKDGWSAGALEPRGAGFLAHGEGMWTFHARPEPATISVGERDGHLYLIVAPASVTGSSDIQLILDPMVPEPSPKKA